MNNSKRLNTMDGAIIARSELVTVTCPDHHQTLTNGLWEFLQCNYGVDFTLKCGGRELNAHRLILDLFLSSDKLQDTVAGRQPSQEPGNRSEMDCLLQFLYRGSVTVPKTQLGILLQLAKHSDFLVLVDALESTPEVRELKANFESPTPVVPTPKVENISIPPQQVPVTLVTENRQSVIETEDEQGKIIVKTEDEYMYEAITLVDLSPEPENVVWDQPDESMADRCDPDDGIIGSCLTEGFDKDFRSTADQHNSQDGNRSWFDPGSASTESSTPIIADIEQETSDQQLDQPEDNRQNQSQMCWKSFSSSSSLQRHNQTLPGAHAQSSPHQAKTISKPDTGRGTFRCDQCGIVCSRADHLKRHQLTHSKERPFQCQLCGMGFNREPHLRRHQMVHSNERPYPCHLCQMTFRDSHSVKRHMLTHGEVPFKCELCYMAFERHSLLKDHLDSHQVARPYKCSVCDKSFKKSSGLANHARQAHTNIT